MARYATTTVNKTAARAANKGYDVEKWKAEKSTEMDTIKQELIDGIRNFSNTELFKHLLDTAAKFHNYSFRNWLMIYMQRPDATRVAGYHKWIELKRQVKKGSKAIKILAPITIKVEEKNRVTGEITEKIIPRFRTVNVFDIRDTEGEDLPSLNDTLADSDTGAEVYTALSMFAGELGISLQDTEVEDMDYEGYFRDSDGKIYIKPTHSQAARAKIITHELTHAVDKDIFETDKAYREVYAESVAYIVCRHFNIPTGDYSFGYVVSWAGIEKGPELIIAMFSKIQKTATMLISRIEGKKQESEVEAE